MEKNKMKSIFAYTLAVLLALQVAVQAGADKAAAGDQQEIKVEADVKAAPGTDVKIEIDEPAPAEKSGK
jgi:hypothetical protein